MSGEQVIEFGVSPVGQIVSHERDETRPSSALILRCIIILRQIRLEYLVQLRCILKSSTEFSTKVMVLLVRAWVNLEPSFQLVSILSFHEIIYLRKKLIDKRHGILVAGMCGRKRMSVLGWGDVLGGFCDE